MTNWKSVAPLLPWQGKLLAIQGTAEIQEGIQLPAHVQRASELRSSWINLNMQKNQ